MPPPLPCREHRQLPKFEKDADTGCPRRHAADTEESMRRHPHLLPTAQKQVSAAPQWVAAPPPDPTPLHRDATHTVHPPRRRDAAVTAAERAQPHTTAANHGTRHRADSSRSDAAPRSGRPHCGIRVNCASYAQIAEKTRKKSKTIGRQTQKELCCTHPRDGAEQNVCRYLTGYRGARV